MKNNFKQHYLQSTYSVQSKPLHQQLATLDTCSWCTLGSLPLDNSIIHPYRQHSFPNTDDNI